LETNRIDTKRKYKEQGKIYQAKTEMFFDVKSGKSYVEGSIYEGRVSKPAFNNGVRI
jgi:hypothetical protein